MSGRFEDFDPNDTKVENCNTCEPYYTGACDGSKGYCKSYKPYRVRTLEDLIKIAIGTNVIFGMLIVILQIIALWR